MRWLRASLLGLLLRAREAASAGRVDGKLNVHLVCHTHDDAGWLKVRGFQACRGPLAGGLGFAHKEFKAIFSFFKELFIISSVFFR